MLVTQVTTEATHRDHQVPQTEVVVVLAPGRGYATAAMVHTSATAATEVRAAMAAPEDLIRRPGRPAQGELLAGPVQPAQQVIQELHQLP